MTQVSQLPCREHMQRVRGAVRRAAVLVHAAHIWGLPGERGRLCQAWSTWQQLPQNGSSAQSTLTMAPADSPPSHAARAHLV